MLYYIAIIWLLQDLDAKTFHKAFVNLYFILADGTFLEANDFFWYNPKGHRPSDVLLVAYETPENYFKS